MRTGDKSISPVLFYAFLVPLSSKSSSLSGVIGNAVGVPRADNRKFVGNFFA